MSEAPRWPTSSSRICASRPRRSTHSLRRSPTGGPRTTRASRTDMNEDWRIHVVVQDTGGRGPWSVDRLEARGLADDVAGELGDRVAVSRDDGELFLYADGEDAARAAERVVRADLDEHGWAGRVGLTRWHARAEGGEAPDLPLPATDAERAAEHAELVAEEDAETAADGSAAWEVRVDLPSHRDAKRLADKLEQDGAEPVRRWKYLFIGAADEDAARDWAEQLRAEAPEGSEITVEATLRSVERNNPFAIFGAGSGEA